MSTTFKTFRPADPTVARYVDYYYLERKPANEVTTFECFPHYNTTISLYANHRMPGVGRIIYDSAASPLQVYTPLRDDVLRVTQTGLVHRVFKATLGVSVKKFHEIVVLRRVIDRRLSGETDENFTQLAYAANYSDQAHMVRVFRKLTHNAPRQFFAKGQLIGQADTFWHRLR